MFKTWQANEASKALTRGAMTGGNDPPGKGKKDKGGAKGQLKPPVEQLKRLALVSLPPAVPCLPNHLALLRVRLISDHQHLRSSHGSHYLTTSSLHH